MEHVSESRRIWLSRIPDWTTPQQLAGGHPRSASGIAKTLSDLVRMGLAEWRLEDGASQFRMTDAGRDAARDT